MNPKPVVLVDPDAFVNQSSLPSWVIRALIDGPGKRTVGVGSLLTIRDLGLIPSQELKEALGFRLGAITEVKEVALAAGVELRD